MKKALLVVSFLFFASVCFAENVYRIHTGFAYIEKDNKPIGIITLPIGAEYHLPLDKILIEVESQEILNSINVVGLESSPIVDLSVYGK